MSNIAIFNEESDTELQILYTEVMDAINTLKEGKSTGIDIISSKLIKHEGNSVVKILTILYQNHGLAKHGQHNDSITSDTNT